MIAQKELGSEKMYQGERCILRRIDSPSSILYDMGVALNMNKLGRWGESAISSKFFFAFRHLPGGIFSNSEVWTP